MQAERNRPHVDVSPKFEIIDLTSGDDAEDDGVSSEPIDLVRGAYISVGLIIAVKCCAPFLVTHLSYWYSLVHRTPFLFRPIFHYGHRTFPRDLPS